MKADSRIETYNKVAAKTAELLWLIERDVDMEEQDWIADIAGDIVAILIVYGGYNISAYDRLTRVYSKAEALYEESKNNKTKENN